MHGKWDRSHVKSIENPVAGSKRPVVALLNASGSEEVRNTHNLPPGQYPLVFKIVEGQEDEHVKKELTRLCNRERGCVELVPPQYYANGITLRDSIRKRIDGWILEQVNVRFLFFVGLRNIMCEEFFCMVLFGGKAGNDVGIQFADGITGDVGEYVRFGVFAFRVYSRAIRIRGVRNFFIETVKSLLETPSDDFQPLADQAFVDRASGYLDQEQE
ncbi:hypothetical protein AM587_10005882 [Phytophthora nicotianae]|uniref:Uncharacterized protein n=1 Tax=Phytophthora nicotianae TaxID=4792 RepID=A0A0W8DVI1_PHYNI|nr:hypothetical protein AM587_10005882 [Phytophthora nicotianae]